MAAVTSLTGELESSTLDYWFHVSSPLDCWSVYETLTDGLAAAKRERREALARHDHAQAARLLVEVTDLTALCAAAAEGLALMRLRFFRAGQTWPLVEYRIEMDWEHATR